MVEFAGGQDDGSVPNLRPRGPRRHSGRRAGILLPAVVLAMVGVPGTDGSTDARPMMAPSLRVDYEAVVTDDPGRVYVEPTVAVDPADPKRMVAAAIHLRGPRADDWQDRQTVVVLASADGGRSWHRRPLDGLPSEWAAGDPWLAWGEGSRVYLSAIVAEALTRRDAEQFTGVFTSDDAGARWTGPARPFPRATAQDHPVIVTAGGGVAVAGSIADRTGDGVYVAQAADGRDLDGIPTRRIEPGWPQVNLGGAAAGEDGAVVISYYTMRPPRRYAVRRVEPDGEPGAETVLADDILPVGFPPVAAGGGGRVLTLWAEGPEPRITLRLAVSDDGGRSWARGGAIEPGAGSTRTLPAVAATRSGAVAAIWQELSGGCARLHGAVSIDGGRSFGPPSPLSAEPSCFGTEANGAAASRFRLGGGDYIGLAAADDAFQAVWADSRTGTFQIRTARLVVDGR